MDFGDGPGCIFEAQLLVVDRQLEAVSRRVGAKGTLRAIGVTSFMLAFVAGALSHDAWLDRLNAIGIGSVDVATLAV